MPSTSSGIAASSETAAISRNASRPGTVAAPRFGSSGVLMPALIDARVLEPAADDGGDLAAQAAREPGDDAARRRRGKGVVPEHLAEEEATLPHRLAGRGERPHTQLGSRLAVARGEVEVDLGGAGAQHVDDRVGDRREHLAGPRVLLLAVHDEHAVAGDGWGGGGRGAGRGGGPSRGHADAPVRGRPARRAANARAARCPSQWLPSSRGYVVRALADAHRART